MEKIRGQTQYLSSGRYKIQQARDGEWLLLEGKTFLGSYDSKQEAIEARDNTQAIFNQNHQNEVHLTGEAKLPFVHFSRGVDPQPFNLDVECGYFTGETKEQVLLAFTDGYQNKSQEIRSRVTAVVIARLKELFIYPVIGTRITVSSKDTGNFAVFTFRFNEA